jgi:hypothetical protein
MVQVVRGRPLTPQARFRARVSSSGFVMDEVALGEVFSEFFGFPNLVPFHRGSPYSHFICGMDKRPVGGRSSQTQSHLIDMNDLGVLHVLPWVKSILCARQCLSVCRDFYTEVGNPKDSYCCTTIGKEAPVLGYVVGQQWRRITIV